MTKHVFHPEVIVDSDDPVAARNVLLRILARAEQNGEIYHFQVGEAE